jgi:hypothetical protein
MPSGQAASAERNMKSAAPPPAARTADDGAQK